MQIYGPYRVSTQSTSHVQSRNVEQTSEVNQTSQVNETNGAGESAETRGSGPVDQLDLSQSANSANRLESTGAVAGEGIRFDRVAELRRQIAEGTYDTAEKMDAALDRMLDRWG